MPKSVANVADEILGIDVIADAIKRLVP